MEGCEQSLHGRNRGLFSVIVLTANVFTNAIVIVSYGFSLSKGALKHYHVYADIKNAQKTHKHYTYIYVFIFIQTCIPNCGLLYGGLCASV